MTLYWDATGLQLRYENGVLTVEDLNPQLQTRWRMSRKEIFILGCRCLLAAMRR